MNSNNREVVVSGPAGTGKSRACLEKLNALSYRYPGARMLIARKTREALSESGLATFEQFVLGDEHPLVKNGPRRNYRQIYEFANSSEIVVGGMDKASKVLSSEYDIIFVQQAEELEEADWEVLTTRLRHGVVPYQQIIGDCNPDKPMHWIKQREFSGALEFIESIHEDNPTLFDVGTGEWTEHGKKYIETLDALTGVRYLRLRKGLWVQAEGMIYEDWDRDIHLIDKRPLPKEWRRFRVVDFGYVHPFVCQWWAVSPDEDLYLYREIYMTRRTVPKHAAQILELSEGERIEDTICDHDFGDVALLEEAGISTTKAQKDISVGIQRTQDRLKVNPDTKRPRLFVMRNALVEIDPVLEMGKKPLCTEQEFEGYVWADTKKKERPVDLDNHGMDTMRYMVMHIDMYSGVLEIGADPFAGYRG